MQVHRPRCRVHRRYSHQGGLRRDPARVAAYLDLENLLYPLRAAGPAALRRGLYAVAAAVRGIGQHHMTVGCGDRDLAAALATEAAALGVRLFPGHPGPDRADAELLERLAGDVPRSCGTVLIGSGDHAFAPAAQRLRAQGHRVLALAVPGSLSAELYVAVDRYVPLRLSQHARSLAV